MEKFFWAACLVSFFTASWALAGNGPETVDLKAAYKIEGKRVRLFFPITNIRKRWNVRSVTRMSRVGGRLLLIL